LCVERGTARSSPELLDSSSSGAMVLVAHVPNYRLYVVSEGPDCFQPIVELFPETEQPPRIVRGDFNYGSPADALVALRRAT
jgi:hypothetical protein